MHDLEQHDLVQGLLGNVERCGSCSVGSPYVLAVWRAQKSATRKSLPKLLLGIGVTLTSTKKNAPDPKCMAFSIHFLQFNSIQNHSRVLLKAERDHLSEIHMRSGLYPSVIAVFSSA